MINVYVTASDSMNLSRDYENGNPDTCQDETFANEMMLLLYRTVSAKL